MRLFQYLSSYAGNLKLPCNATKHLQTVFNISFCHDNEEISGDFLVHSPAQFSTEVLDQVEANSLDFLKRHGFKSKKNLARAAGSANYSVIIPNLSVERYTLLSNIISINLIADDFFDGPLLSRPENIDMVIRMNRTAREHFRGNASPINEDISAAFPKFVDICRMHLELGVSLLEIGSDLQYVYRGFDLMIVGIVDQVKFERAKSPEEYLKRKTDNFGMLLYFALNGALAGETLTEQVRNSAVFKKFEHVAATMITLALDPMSIVYDLLHGVRNDNYSLLLTQQGVSVKDAVHYSINRYNQLFIESLGLIAELNRMNIRESDRRYLRLYLKSVRGGLEFSPHHTRYFPNRELKYEEIDDKDRVAKCVVDALHAMPSI